MCTGLTGKKRGKKSQFTLEIKILHWLLHYCFRCIDSYTFIKAVIGEYSHKTPVFVALKLCYDFTHTGVVPPAPANQGEWAEYASELAWMIKKMDLLSGVVYCSSWFPLGPIPGFEMSSSALQKDKEHASRLSVPPKVSWAFCPPINPAGMWTGCKGFINLLLASPIAILNGIQEGQKLFKHGRGIHFLFSKSNAAKSWISDGMSPQPQACILSTANCLNVPNWDCCCWQTHVFLLCLHHDCLKRWSLHHVSSVEKQNDNV